MTPRGRAGGAPDSTDPVTSWGLPNAEAAPRTSKLKAPEKLQSVSFRDQRFLSLFSTAVCSVPRRESYTVDPLPRASG